MDMPNQMPGTGGTGFISVKSNDDLIREEQARIAAAQAAQSAGQVTNLAGHIARCFQEAQSHKATYITERLLDCKRRRAGEYHPDVLAEIKRQGGSESYHNITDTKCGDAESWILDVIAPSGDKPWSIVPTPIPALDDEQNQQAINATVEYFNANPDVPQTPENIQAFANDLYDEMLKVRVEDAAEKARRMEQVIEDQLAEARFTQVLHKFIHYLSTYPAACVKGPVLKNKKVLAWNGSSVEVQTKPVHTFEAVSPFDVFPAPNARHADEGYVCNVISMNVRDLAAMKDMEGWNSDAIDLVLSESSGPGTADVQSTISGEWERARMENRDSTIRGGVAVGTVTGVDFWGPVQGEMLIEWGLEVESKTDWYEIHAIKLGQYVVYAVLNPDPLDHRPFYFTSYEKDPNGIWGRAIPEKMKDSQDQCAATARNLINNLAFSSGPMFWLDVDAWAGGQDITPNPWKGYQFKLKNYQNSRVPMEFFQPSNNSGALLQVMEAYKQKADDDTSIPRYAHGNENVGGAGQTASGLSQLMQAASKGIRRVIGYIDEDIIRPVVEALYNWNMMYHDDPSIKGDAQVVPRGVMATLVREQTRLRQQEFLLNTNNPTDIAIIGMEGRAHVLREVAKNLDMDVDKIVPDAETLRARQEQALMQQQAVAMANQEQEEQGSERMET